MALLLFLLAKVALTSLSTAHFVALRAIFPFRQGHFAQVCPLKPTPFSKFFAGLGSINKSAISFLFFNSCSVLATLFSPPSFLLSQTLWEIWQKLFSLSTFTIGLQWFFSHLFLPRNDADDELGRQGRLLLFSPSLVVSLLLLLVSTTQLFSG